MGFDFEVASGRDSGWLVAVLGRVRGVRVRNSAPSRTGGGRESGGVESERREWRGGRVRVEQSAPATYTHAQMHRRAYTQRAHRRRQQPQLSPPPPPASPRPHAAEAPRNEATTRATPHAHTRRGCLAAGSAFSHKQRATLHFPFITAFFLVGVLCTFAAVASVDVCRCV